MKRMVSIFSVVFVTLFLLASTVTALPSTIYVNGFCGDNTWLGTDPNCAAPNNEGPKRTIQAALTAAVSGDTVLVADGVYSGPGNTKLNFDGKAIILRAQNGPGNCTIDCQNNTQAFVFDNAETPDSVVDGFTMVNGSADSGGAVSCITNSSPTLTNCFFTSNHATNRGGAIFCEGQSRPQISYCGFNGNFSNGGGGAIYCGTDGHAVISYCTFTGNHAVGYNYSHIGGGAIGCESSHPAISHCDMIGNSSIIGGAIGCYSGSPVISVCTLNGNTATESGGAISCRYSSSPLIGSSTLNGNTARRGGALSCEEESTPTVSSCYINNNTVTEEGGGIHSSQSSPNITNCTLSGNTAVNNGGGISCVFSNALISYCNISGNSTSEAQSMGGGIYCYQGSPSISHCQIGSNQAILGGGGFGCGQSAASISGCTITNNHADNGGGINANAQSSLTVIDCTIEHNSADDSGGGMSGDSSSLFISKSNFTSNVSANYGGLKSTNCQLNLSNCVLAANASITSPASALKVENGTVTMTNCTLADNWTGNASDASVVFYHVIGSPIVRNCIFWNPWSERQLYLDNTFAQLSYCDVLSGWPGIGNFDQDPCFAASGYWDENQTPDFWDDDIWVPGDYHLKAGAGRWNPALQTWVLDDVTSPCIDTGDPASGVMQEPMPHGDRINLGAYGGTQFASKSVFCFGPLDGDVNGDCRINLADLALLGANWLQCNILPAAECWN